MGSSQTRVIVAPFQGQLERVFVQRGDQIFRDTALAKMKTSAIELELAELDARLAVLELDIRRAASQRARSDLVNFQAQREEVLAQRLLWLDQRDRAEVVASEDSLVVDAAAATELAVRSTWEKSC